MCVSFAIFFPFPCFALEILIPKRFRLHVLITAVIPQEKTLIAKDHNLITELI